MDYVTETTKLLASPKGVLLMVNNYTGDRMAFEMGAEMAEADGVKVEHAHRQRRRRRQGLHLHVGRRGVAGNFFVIKAVGAASEKGADLDELRPDRREGQLGDAHDGHRADVVHAAGQGLAAVRARRRRDRDGRRDPRRARPAPAEDGQRRRDRRRAARRDRPRPAVQPRRQGRADGQRPRRHPDQRALHPLRLGTTSSPSRGIEVGRSYVGEYCTSLDMAGASITLVKLDDEIEACSRRPRRSPSGCSSRPRRGLARGAVQPGSAVQPAPGQPASARPIAKAASRSWREAGDVCASASRSRPAPC